MQLEAFNLQGQCFAYLMPEYLRCVRDYLAGALSFDTVHILFLLHTYIYHSRYSVQSQSESSHSSQQTTVCLSKFVHPVGCAFCSPFFLKLPGTLRHVPHAHR